jgi:hypothetical protein
VRMSPFVRMNPKHTRMAAVLLNNGFDPVEEINLTLRANLSKVCRVAPSGEIIPLPLRRISGDTTVPGIVVTLKDVPAWQTAILVGE